MSVHNGARYSARYSARHSARPSGAEIEIEIDHRPETVEIDRRPFCCRGSKKRSLASEDPYRTTCPLGELKFSSQVQTARAPRRRRSGQAREQP